MIVVQTQRQLAKIRIIQSFDVGITTTRMETVVMPNIDVIEMGVIIGFATNWVMDWVES
jgi:hypothetical protein